MEKLNEFREELKGKILDYATTFQLISGATLKDKKKQDELNEKNYEKLEKFILETYNTWMLDGVKKVNIEPPVPTKETVNLDF